MNSKQLITIPLSTFVDSHLGRGLQVSADGSMMVNSIQYYCRPIDKDIADLIFSITENKTLCHIEYPDINSPHLSSPMLWDIGAWNTHYDKWMREKKRAEKERIDRHIFEENVRLIANAYMKFTECPNREAAEQLASKLLRNNKLATIKMLGVKKLITTTEEIK